MSRTYKLFIFLLTISITSCVSDYSTINASNDEDKDIGLGGTGLLANTGSGLGGTGIIGEITGFGSVFVNGIEIEYNNKTPFTINGKEATHQQLEIGDVIEVLTINSSNHTQAQIINLRHEVIGKVDSVSPETFSYTVQGQTIIQKQHKDMLPKVGATVAVSGIRIDEQTIMSTRTTETDTKQVLLRAHTELPFKEQASRWSIQIHIKNGQPAIQMDGTTQILATDNQLAESLKNVSAITIMELHKSESGQFQLDQIIDPLNMPSGHVLPIHKQKNGNNRIQRTISIQPRTSRGIR